MKRGWVGGAIVCAAALLAVELVLQAAGAILARRPSREASAQAPAICVAGDSWTQGADAPAGEGYIDLFAARLAAAHPGKTQIVNVGQASYNSSEAILQFLTRSEARDAKVVLFLAGANNEWNTSNVELANASLRNALDGAPLASGDAARLRAKGFLLDLKTVRLLRMLRFHLYRRLHPYEPPMPMTAQLTPFFMAAGDGRLDQARRDLLARTGTPAEYDDMYRALVWSFDQSPKAAKDYLLAQKFWRPEWVRYRFDESQHRRWVTKPYELLDEQLRLLAEYCARRRIRLVLQTYPFFRPGILQVNAVVRDVAAKQKTGLIDHETVFRETLGADCAKHQTTAHVDPFGYRLMADAVWKASAAFVNEDGSLRESDDTKGKVR